MRGNQSSQYDRDEARNAIPGASAQAHVGPLLEAFHAGTLPATEAALVERHLRDCAVCRQQSDAIALYQIIRAAPSPTVGPELRERVYARIAAAPAPRAVGPFTLRERQGRPFALPPARPRRGHSERGLLSAAVAVIIVALLASVFWALPHLRGGVGHGSAPAAITRACPSGSATRLPANTYISDMAMASANEGWAVGGIYNGQGVATESLLIRFSACHLARFPLDLSNVGLNSISMDSPLDGWAVGVNEVSLAPVLLHFSAGAWRQVSLPPQAPAQGSFDTIRMRTANEGWIILNGVKNSQGMLTYGLLHYANGAWSPVNCPLSAISDVAPVGPNDIWVTGTDTQTADHTRVAEFAHYHNGQWTMTPQPTGVGFDILHAVSPTDIWASGQRLVNLPDVYPAIARYDGSSWQVAPYALPSGAGQGYQALVLGDGMGWAFRTVTLSRKPPNVTPETSLVTSVLRETDGQWQAVGWPYKDIAAIRALTPTSDGGAWMVGQVMTLTSTGANSSVGLIHSVLLYYANGAWTRYD